MDKDRLNGSGYVDNTAYDAIRNAERQKREDTGKTERDVAADVLVKTIKDMMWLAGFKPVGRIQFEDPKTGKKYL